MKKYLYPFLAVLMTLSSFAFVSCSEDDDLTGDSDIVNTDTNYNITLNGVKLFNSSPLWTLSGFEEDQPIYDKMLSIAIYNSVMEDYLDYFMISFPVDDISLHEGMDLCNEKNLMDGLDYHKDDPLSIIMFNLSVGNPRSLSLSSDFYSGYMMKGGSMIVEKYTGERIRLRLTNCKFVDVNDYLKNYSNREIITINGTIDVPLDNEIHKL